MVVVFPAPFGPRKPRISPFSTRKEIPSTAVARPYRLLRLSTSIMVLVSPFLDVRPPGRGRVPWTHQPLRRSRFPDRLVGRTRPRVCGASAAGDPRVPAPCPGRVSYRRDFSGVNRGYAPGIPGQDHAARRHAQDRQPRAAGAGPAGDHPPAHGRAAARARRRGATLLLWDRKLESFDVVEVGENGAAAAVARAAARRGRGRRRAGCSRTATCSTHRGRAGTASSCRCSRARASSGTLALGAVARRRLPLADAEARLVSLIAARAALALENHAYQRELIASERLAALGTFAGMLAHDFRGPMTVIRGYAETLLDARRAARGGERPRRADHRRDRPPGPHDRRDAGLRARRRAAGAAARLARQLRRPSWRQPSRRSCPASRSQRDICLEPGRRVALDVDKLRRAVATSPRTRARRWAGRDASALRARVEPRQATSGPPEQLVLELGDEGPGVPAEIRERVFEPFVTLGKKRGTGLGLAVARRFVEDHGGSLELLRLAAAARARRPLPARASRSSGATRSRRARIWPCPPGARLHRRSRSPSPCLAGCRSHDAAKELAVSGIETYWVVDSPQAGRELRRARGALPPEEHGQGAARLGRRPRALPRAGPGRGLGFDPGAGQPLEEAPRSGQEVTVTVRSAGRYHSKAEPEDILRSPGFKDPKAEIYVRIGASPWAMLGEAAVERRIGAPGSQLARPDAHDGWHALKPTDRRVARAGRGPHVPAARAHARAAGRGGVPLLRPRLPDEEYFDEVYHAKTALQYLNGEPPTEWVHPPTAKLLIAVPVWLFGYHPWAWRLAPAIAGTLLAGVFLLLARRVLPSERAALLATLVLLCDGVFLVQSRVAMTNVFAVLFQLLSVLLCCAGRDARRLRAHGCDRPGAGARAGALDPLDQPLRLGLHRAAVPGAALETRGESPPPELDAPAPAHPAAEAALALLAFALDPIARVPARATCR